MALLVQQTMFENTDGEPAPIHELSRTNLGTFQDSLRAPIHRWFTYPAGFSYKAVEETIRLYDMKPGMTIYDPFAGTATTNIVASEQGIHSFGVEAHPFVHFVGRTKLFWNFTFSDLHIEVDNLIKRIHQSIEADTTTRSTKDIFPELVYKCYSDEKLFQLYHCREIITALPATPFRDFAKLGLTNLLRSIADVATGWPYIAPQKARKITKVENIDIAEKLREQLYQMYQDLRYMHTKVDIKGNATLISGDSRQRQDVIASSSVDLCFTSPLYLNNYDYSDRTRLEMYFWGEAINWGDITKKVRSRLIMSATTQIVRSLYDEMNLLNEDFIATAPNIFAELKPKVTEMSRLRLTKGGKKSYDIMVAGYFNDMLNVFRETFRILKPGSSFLLILGDSAPYGVHIPTDVYLGELGLAIGFARYKIEDLRTRGDKWKDNPQRHKVALKESILTLEKS